MKKYLVAIIALVTFVTGCSNSVNINNPYEVYSHNKVLSYYDTKEDIEKNFNINISNNIGDSIGLLQKSNTVIVDENEIIRSISITDKDFVTYKNISVGDKINKVEDTFLYEFKIDNTYMVLFDGNTEKNPVDSNKEDDWIWINYHFDEDSNSITLIQICDVLFGRDKK